MKSPEMGPKLRKPGEKFLVIFYFSITGRKVG